MGIYNKIFRLRQQPFHTVPLAAHVCCFRGLSAWLRLNFSSTSGHVYYPNCLPGHDSHERLVCRVTSLTSVVFRVTSVTSVVSRVTSVSQWSVVSRLLVSGLSCHVYFFLGLQGLACKFGCPVWSRLLVQWSVGPHLLHQWSVGSRMVLQWPVQSRV